ncbi:uncharacterized protein LOC126264915 [Aethina tumida]|uniref:uncharacterized protein LOC126264915 n=1 Tax=Aethina tumida TaxID=116153 RepID=UPI0021491BF8|nr:uncharacterized protein LOC126264915 [Aethina tumida]
MRGQLIEKRNIDYLRVVLKFGGVLGITPWYSFEKRKLVKTNLYKLYAITLGVIYAILVAVTVYFRIKNFILRFPTEVFLDCFSDAALTLLILIRLFKSATTVNQKKMEKLMRSLFELDDRLRVKQENVVLHKCYVELVIGHLLFVTYYLFEIHICLSTLGSLYFYQYKYEDINMLLLDIQKRYIPLLQNIDKYTAVDLITHRQQYIKLGEIVELFNELYGYAILIITLHSVLQILNCANFGLSLLINNTPTSVEIFTSNIYFGLLLVGISMYLIMSCDATCAEGRRVLRICARLQEIFPPHSQSREEIVHFVTTAKIYQPRFVSAGFFEVNSYTVQWIVK